MSNIAVLGAGTWGIALARLQANKGNDVTVWSALPGEVKELSETRLHKNLPNMQVPQSIQFTTSLEEACKGRDLIVFAVPSVFIRSTARNAKAFISPDQLIVTVAKGLEPGTLMTMSQIIGQELGNEERIAALSGPTHAEEVAQDMLTTIVAACGDLKKAETVQELFTTDFMRVYTNTDILGVELCGALKNVMALAAGISDGLGYGDNAKAAIITRGILELSRLGEAMGCNPQTFMGLAGIGDLIVTATSRHSRNNRAGFLMGQGYSAKEATEKVGMVVEGLNALEGALELSKEHNVEVPLVEAVNQVVNSGTSARDIVATLMGRQKKTEFCGN